MFWAKARKAYSHLTADDPDIRRYLAVTHELQEGGYQGLTGVIQDIGHRWIAARTPAGKVLEIGFGSGRHAHFFRGDRKEYFVSEYASGHLKSAAWTHARNRGVRCDARQLPFMDGTFDTVISIYNLEHIRQLQRVLEEVHRVLASDGRFLIALPCEGGLLWNVGRELTTRRTIQAKYGINYDKVIAYEHVWDFRGVYRHILECGLFHIEMRRFLPLLLPLADLNLIACLDCSRI